MGLLLTLVFGQASPSRIDWVTAAKLMDRQAADIENRLAQMLFGDSPATIKLDDCPREVSKLAAIRVLTVEQGQPEMLDPMRPILEVYDRKDIKGRLLIRGDTGAGKTTMLLGLAQQL
ncbi:MAG: hypothetical protein HC805_06405 [Alkalinema sp. RL_2_19]|nr:hypothetical protein [Alkalinema sp. RL_2_19]